MNNHGYCSKEMDKYEEIIRIKIEDCEDLKELDKLAYFLLKLNEWRKVGLEKYEKQLNKRGE